MNSNTFDSLIDDVLRREGGYVDHKSDRGGATKYGITQRVYSDWSTSGHMDVSRITEAEARLIYLANYWKPSKADQLPDTVRDVHFDAAINHGVGRAAKLLQAACGAKQDGVIGPATLALANATPPDVLRARYLVARYRFYGAIVARDKTQLVFIAGWMNRMTEFSL